MTGGVPRPWSWPSFDEAPEQTTPCDREAGGDCEEAARELARARDDADRIRREARAEAWAQARAEADASLEAAIREAAREQTEAFAAARDALVAQIEIATSERLVELEQELVGLIATMAEKVIRRKVEAEDGVVLDVVRETIARASGASRLNVRVSAPEEALVRAATAELLAAAEGAEGLEISADPEIGRGGCIIETERGRFDARIETQIELLGEEIAQALGGGRGA